MFFIEPFYGFYGIFLWFLWNHFMVFMEPSSVLLMLKVELSKRLTMELYGNNFFFIGSFIFLIIKFCPSEVIKKVSSLDFCGRE